MNISDFTGPGSLFISIAVFIYTYKNFKRLKSFDNENHFYKYKIENYQPIIINGYKMLDAYEEAKPTFEDIIETKNQEKAEEISDQLDEITDQFRNALITHAFFLPENILNLLQHFYEELYSTIEDAELNMHVFEKNYEYFEDQLILILNLMREDLGIDSINTRLKKRLSGS